MFLCFLEVLKKTVFGFKSSYLLLQKVCFQLPVSTLITLLDGPHAWKRPKTSLHPAAGRGVTSPTWKGCRCPCVTSQMADVHICACALARTLWEVEQETNFPHSLAVHWQGRNTGGCAEKHRRALVRLQHLIFFGKEPKMRNRCKQTRWDLKLKGVWA